MNQSIIMLIGCVVRADLPSCVYGANNSFHSSLNRAMVLCVNRCKNLFKTGAGVHHSRLWGWVFGCIFCKKN